MAVTAVSGRIHAVKEVHASVHRLQNIGRRSHAHQVRRLVFRQIRHRLIQNPVHLLVALANRQTAKGIPVQIHGRDGLRVGNPDILERTALVDAKQQLVLVDGVRQGVESCHLRPAPLQPSGGSVHGSLHILSRGRMRRALVKGHGNGGSQIRLNLHALLRPHEYLSAVNVGVKVHSLLLNLSKSRQGKHLKAAGVRQDRSVPVHELVQAAKLLNQLVPGPHMKMVGVGQLHLGSDFF